ncbi:lytic polysaccharide monooxygenase auxiliary activity family 9 protein [Myceligenerans salitolerans]|uniref:Lytic polysaccharide monooxygenase n=1 Tax=Myceligenerans salitolerans TaxID=1230528 RepID=A0ABS3I4W6_9MICO|nr:lytic polysaccharide monooxygenase [Myceligenerans salitolerans]MBO0608018.1 lytic polysaccharide monooxygenase [Myceligenerans salitolerans]
MTATTKKVTRVRAVVMAAALALLGALLVVVADPAPPTAGAHGTPLFPESRTYACYRDGIDNGEGGGLNPQNPKCAAALQQHGNYAFYNWFGNLISDAGDRHREIIPDGNLCGPGPDFAGMRPGGTDWPTTQVAAGQNVTFRYSAWAAHPGKFMQYVTRDGWDPSQPLTWSDLEPEPFDVAYDPPTQSGPEGAEYYWNATLPNKQGRHIIYSIWERSDSPEAFYSCSDVVFGEGDGEPEPTPTPTPDPTPTPTPDPTQEPGGCEVSITSVNSWDGGYQGAGEVTTDTAVSSWDLEVTFPGGDTVTQSWNSTYAQTGATVTFSNTGWNGSVPAGGSATFGYLANGGPSTPSSATLNGAACSIG